MEIKLNHYTLLLLCGLVSGVTFAIILLTIYCVKENTRSSKKKTKTENDNGEYEDDTEEYEDTNYCIQKSKDRKDSIDLARKKIQPSEANEEVQYTNDYNNDDIEEDAQYDERKDNQWKYRDEGPENFTPAQMLEERIERSRKSNCGSGGRRGTIAFADELQDTLADHFKQIASYPDIIVDGTEGKKNSSCD